MEEDVQFDLRQIKLMLNIILTTRNKEITLNKAIVDSWALLDLLKTIEFQWKVEYRNLVDSIEDIYANAMAEERNLNENENEKINQILDEMKQKAESFLSTSNQAAK